MEDLEGLQEGPHQGHILVRVKVGRSHPSSRVVEFVDVTSCVEGKVMTVER